MNWMIRLGTWWQDRAKRTEKALACDVNARFEALDLKLNQAPKIESQLAPIKARLDRVELFTGLKREPTPITLAGEARIQ